MGRQFKSQPLERQSGTPLELLYQMIFQKMFSSKNLRSLEATPQMQFLGKNHLSDAGLRLHSIKPSTDCLKTKNSVIGTSMPLKSCQRSLSTQGLESGRRIQRLTIKSLLMVLVSVTNSRTGRVISKSPKMRQSRKEKYKMEA